MTHYAAVDPYHVNEELNKLNIKKDLGYEITVDMFKGDW